MNELMTPFLVALHATSPDPRQADALALYGQLVGSWEFDNTDYGPDGTSHHAVGEWHFGWVLQGRMLQDVYILPKRGEPVPEGVKSRYGTTLRVYDPTSHTWRIDYINPANRAGPYHVWLTAKREGADIVQEGRDLDGSMMRWSFREITPSSFHWVGETSKDGRSWRVEQEMRARRVR
jgi:hypothetical protein